MVHHYVCPLCSSEKISLHFRCTDHFISKEVFEIYKCSSCSFEFTQDHPDESEIGRFYNSEEYISHNDTSKGFSNKIYRVARKVMLHKKKRIIKKVTGLDHGSLLDIGSGTGYFAWTMKKEGWQVKGVEINKKARDFSISQFGIDVQGPDQLSEMEANSFDCITLWHVLEHFHDPFKYITDILHLLKPGGLCVIALPNSNSYDANYYGQFWAAYDVPRHLWHYNPASFRIFTEKAGFVSDNIGILPLDVFYISILSERYKGSRQAFLRGMVRALPLAVFSALKKIKCSSIIYFLRKP